MASGEVDSLPFHTAPTNANYWRASKGDRNESESMLWHAGLEWDEDNYRDFGQQIPGRRLGSDAGEPLWATRRGDQGSDLLGNRPAESRLRILRFTSMRASTAAK